MTVWKLDVDSTCCIGSGVCAGTAPELFVLEDDQARPVRAETAPDETALDAADSCPVAAITVRDETGETIGPRP
ncbi:MULTISPECIES: ferredoxin [Streptomyces]|uniref:Ferredoxin n=1 Tax=Streptomyces lycii TaxID=2654337 RepID=A0ABQ7FQ24_9ACTN|nr:MULTISPECIES: ferredoxin [Streptomyces]KAF4410083.1 ferredoxin [Streptomyces lycii]PGH51986.1 cytochrome [Streptomyces sp. Ru87]